MFKHLLNKMFSMATELSIKNNLSLFEINPAARLLDLGCGTADITLRSAEAIGTKDILGVDSAAQRLDKASSKNIVLIKADLNSRLPFDSRHFDVIVANQVIEHLSDTDNFIAEMYRVLKPGGYAVICTENLSSWHNILPLFLGWQPFSLTNISVEKRAIGNPWALHRNGEITPDADQHVRVFSFLALREAFKAHNFKIEKILGAGYYPFPVELGIFDPRHAAFLSLKVRK
ncbi:MAG: class I SAM-dependent methyltransferase [Candidatus Omnitrophota bacterium]